MADLSPGYTVETDNFCQVTILEKLGEGGQGAVYKVDYNGQVKALKWYLPRALRDPDKFYKNIQNNINKGAPTDAFLWPQDITVRQDGSFGYIMELRPPQYQDFALFLLAKVRFASVAAMVEAALNIVAGFRALHLNGFSYQDLNDGNFFVDPQNGDVLICDNDNVSGEGYNSGIAGKCRYMAPEVVVGKKMPDVLTDRFSLAVVLFLLFVNNHPLEGRAVTKKPCMTEELERLFYGEKPVFIFDPNDDSNRPERGIHKNAINRWPLYPRYIRDLFTKAFSQEVMSGAKPSVIEKEWIEALIRMKSELFKCVCGDESFLTAENAVACGTCGSTLSAPVYLQTAKYTIPLYPGAKLYKCHTAADSYDYKTISAEIIANKKDPSKWGMRNLSDESWYVTDLKGEQTPLKKSEVTRIRKGLGLNFSSTTAAII